MSSPPPGIPTPYCIGARLSATKPLAFRAAILAIRRYGASPMAIGRIPPSGLGNTISLEVTHCVGLPPLPDKIRLKTLRSDSRHLTAAAAASLLAIVVNFVSISCFTKSKVQPVCAPAESAGASLMPDSISASVMDNCVVSSSPIDITSLSSSVAAGCSALMRDKKSPD